MVNKVELIPISEGNRITVKENEKVVIGRGSSLGVRLIIFLKKYLKYFCTRSVMKRKSLVIMLN